SCRPRPVRRRPATACRTSIFRSPRLRRANTSSRSRRATPKSCSVSVLLPKLLAGVLAVAAITVPDPVHTVPIDVVAVDRKGAAVATLQQRDFEVREDGNLITPDQVRLVQHAPRLVGIYLDEYHITAGENADRARAAIGAFLDQLSPDDRVVVAKPL